MVNVGPSPAYKLPTPSLKNMCRSVPKVPRGCFTPRSNGADVALLVVHEGHSRNFLVGNKQSPRPLFRITQSQDAAAAEVVRSGARWTWVRTLTTSKGCTAKAVRKDPTVPDTILACVSWNLRSCTMVMLVERKWMNEGNRKNESESRGDWWFRWWFLGCFSSFFLFFEGLELQTRTLKNTKKLTHRQPSSRHTCRNFRFFAFRRRWPASVPYWYGRPTVLVPFWIPNSMSANYSMYFLLLVRPPL